MRAAGGGLTRTETSALFQRNASAVEIERALQLLSAVELAEIKDSGTGSRVAEQWVAL